MSLVKKLDKKESLVRGGISYSKKERNPVLCKQASGAVRAEPLVNP